MTVGRTRNGLSADFTESGGGYASVNGSRGSGLAAGGGGGFSAGIAW